MSEDDGLEVSELETIEVRLLVEALHQRWGFDFRHYANASLTRRFRNVLTMSGLPSYSALQHEVLRDRGRLDGLLNSLLVPTTEMFRDPPCFIALARGALGFLATYPRITVWCAGCSTGEEVYSLAILLTEAGLYDRSRIYATDIGKSALSIAEQGAYPVESVRAFTRNYQAANGKGSFSDYYMAAHGQAQFTASLKRNIVFTDHNLVTDGPFIAPHLILCRNVFIYFDRTLQDRVARLFAGCLEPRGFLMLGNRETLRFTQVADRFQELENGTKLYRLR